MILVLAGAYLGAGSAGTGAEEPSVSQRGEEPKGPGEEDHSLAREVEGLSREYSELYRESARKYGFGGDWYVLAAVGKVETEHGHDIEDSVAGAQGPMQFTPSTWESFGVDGNSDGAKDIMDPEDAIPAAARYLKASGAPEDWSSALLAYNRANWYVEEVLAVAQHYRELDREQKPGS